MKALPLNIVVSPLVSYALQENKAVVALESTVITHGLPYPQNLKIWRNWKNWSFPWEPCQLQLSFWRHSSYRIG